MTLFSSLQFTSRRICVWDAGSAAKATPFSSCRANTVVRLMRGEDEGQHAACLYVCTHAVTHVSGRRAPWAAVLLSSVPTIVFVRTCMAGLQCMFTQVQAAHFGCPLACVNMHRRLGDSRGVPPAPV